MSNKLHGSISIARGSDHMIRITIEDELSGSQFIEVELTVENYGNLVSGLGGVDCEFEFRPKLVGLKREYKEEIVTRLTKDYAITDAEVDAVLQPYEVDGWRGSRSDLKNQHRRVGHDKDGYGKYRVSFVRYVEPDELTPKETGEP